LNIAPKPTGSKAKVQIDNLLPGQKVKVTISDLSLLTKKKPAPKAKTTKKPAPKQKKKSVTIVQKPSQKGTKIGVQNLKPGQKVKVTIKSGARP
jgi:predicted DNA-binding antitoxin AbrB/MazE fold protein